MAKSTKEYTCSKCGKTHKTFSKMHYNYNANKDGSILICTTCLYGKRIK